MIYIAGSFSSEKSKEYLNEMINYVKKSFPSERLFIPNQNIVPDAWDKENFIWASCVYQNDVYEGLQKSDKIFMCYQGHISGTGTAWEIGYAKALQDSGKNIQIFLWIPPDCLKNDMSLMVIYSGIPVNFNPKELNYK